MISNLKALWHKLTAPRATDEDEARREYIANVIAERERLLVAERAQARRQAALFRLSAELAATLDEAEVCRRVVDGLHDTLGYDFVVLFLVDETTGDRVLAASVGFVEPVTPLPPGQGLSERPLLDGQLHYMPDVTQDPRYFYGMGGSEVDVPIRIGEEVLGVLTAENKQRDAFSQDDFEVLTAAAQQAGLAIEKARLLAAERRRADQLEALRTTMADITSELELSALLRVIVERAAGLLDATGGELGLYDEASQEIRIVVSNLGEDYVGTRLGLGEGAMGRVAETGEPLIIKDYHAWEGGLTQYSNIRATLAAPLKVGGRLVGVFTTATTDPVRQFSPADLHLLNLFAQQAAIAIENARLYDQAQREIAERRKFEEEIRRQKEYFEALFVNNPVAVVTADLDGVVVSWNPMAEKLFGYTQEEVIGNDLDDFVANDDSIRAEAVGYTHQVINVGRVQVATRRTRKDGSLVDVELLALPVILAGEKVGFIAIYHDVTERKRFEEEIRRQKEYFEALFVNSPVAVMTTDLDANVVSWNPMADKLFGYTQEEAIGRNADDLVANDPRVREEALDYTKQVATMGRVQAATKRTRKDGSLVDVEALALPVIVGEEKVGYIAIYIDITDLQEARRQAEAANQAKSTFLANMSHELRTPLNSILGFTQLMDHDANLTTEQQRNLEIINRSGEHLLTLINDVLETSKIEAGRVTLQERDFDLYHLLDGLEEMFGLRAEDKGLTLIFDRSPDVPQYVCADESKLRQVLMNLLGNAVKFTEEGGVTLRIGCSSPASRVEGQGETRLRFEVEDTGPGIAPEELATVFDPFVQAASVWQSQEGTGLGLSISLQFVRLMGGDLTASSPPSVLPAKRGPPLCGGEVKGGQGVLFKFDVPIELADAAEVRTEQRWRRVVGLEPNQPVYRLLVAEDREADRQLLIKLLTDLGPPPLGFEVQGAVNGQEALEIWEDWEPHLIWMDMRMPVMDGHEATHRIKATTEGQATVIIALTASAFEEDREMILAEGCDGFVRKPFRRDEIFDMLAKHLGVRFVYEEQARPLAARLADAASPADVLTPVSLAALPADWVADLQQATILGNLDSILALVDQIRGQDAALANALTELADNFDHGTILAWLSQEKP